MKILIICSKNFYSEIKKIKLNLEGMGHQIYLSNCYDDPASEEKYRLLGEEEHRAFKARMFKQSEDIIRKMDAVLVLNYNKEKDGKTFENYIGGATFLEMYDAFRMGKAIYLMNPIPNNILFDEIGGFGPIILNGNLDLIKNVSMYDMKKFDLENYMMWLASFSETFPFFWNDNWENNNDSVVTDEDLENVKLLHELYSILLNKSGAIFGEPIKFKFDSIGYEIDVLEDDLVSYSVKRESINSATDSEYIDVEQLLYSNTCENDDSKRHVYGPKKC